MSSETVTSTLLDIFLRNDPILEDPPFSAEGCVDTHDADVQEGHEARDKGFDMQKLGRDMKTFGDDFNKKYAKVKHRSLKNDVKEFFDEKISSAGGNPEEFYPRFRDIMDGAVKDTGVDDNLKILGGLLLSVKGLAYLGDSARLVIKRYIDEKNLESAFRNIGIKNEGHHHLD